MKEISNLKELQNVIGEEMVEKCVTEYIMLLVARANQYDTMTTLFKKLQKSYKKVSKQPNEEELQRFYQMVTSLLEEYDAL